MTGFAWTPLPGEKTTADVDRAEGDLVGFVDEMMDLHHTEAGQLILGGFSQGGMMTYQVGLPRPDVFAGLAALSARVEGSDVLRKRLPADPSQPIFVAHGTLDAIIPIDHGRRSRDFLQEAGYAPSYYEYPMAHQITEDVLDNLRPWIIETLPPLS